MAPQKSPAFSFYAKDFLTGTASMGLQEVGAYVRLLAYEWDAGGVPANAHERARVLGCSKAQERDLWIKVGKKFVLRGDVYLNERLEDERAKQTERRQRLSDNGKHGGRPKANGKQTESNSFPVAKATGKLNESLPSSSPDDQEVNGSPTTTHRGVGLVVSPLEFHNLSQHNAFVGAKLRVPKKLHAELVTKSGANADVELRAWYEQLDAQLEASGKGTGDVFEWLRPRHQAYAIEKNWIEPAPIAAKKSRESGAEIAARILAKREGRAAH